MQLIVSCIWHWSRICWDWKSEGPKRDYCNDAVCLHIRRKLFCLSFVFLKLLSSLIWMPLMNSSGKWPQDSYFDALCTVSWAMNTRVIFYQLLWSRKAFVCCITGQLKRFKHAPLPNTWIKAFCRKLICATAPQKIEHNSKLIYPTQNNHFTG